MAALILAKESFLNEHRRIYPEKVKAVLDHFTRWSKRAIKAGILTGLKTTKLA